MPPCYGYSIVFCLRHTIFVIVLLCMYLKIPSFFVFWNLSFLTLRHTHSMPVKPAVDMVSFCQRALNTFNNRFIRASMVLLPLPVVFASYRLDISDIEKDPDR